MPNREIHRPVAAVLGTGYSGYRAYHRHRQQPTPAAFIIAEALGGFAGGWIGGALPDLIDPPTSPNHRHFGHGVATVAGAVVWTAEALARLQEKLRHKADELRRDRLRLQNDFERLVSEVAEFLLRFVAGLFDGLIAGYVSHLALDFCTPTGLPLIARGC